MESLLMKDAYQQEALSDLFLSWTLRAAADNFPHKQKQPKLNIKCRKILSKLIYGLELENQIKETDKVISVDVWRQWNHIDLHANIILEIDGKEEYHLLVIENKAYTPIHDNQLKRYKDLIDKVYGNDPDLKLFDRHFILITFLDDNTDTYKTMEQECIKEGYQCIPILDLQGNDVPQNEETESDIFNEFWLRSW